MDLVGEKLNAVFPELNKNRCKFQNLKGTQMIKRSISLEDA